jgi:hypothetical protein
MTRGGGLEGAAATCETQCAGVGVDRAHVGFLARRRRLTGRGTPSSLVRRSAATRRCPASRSVRSE